ncbi:MAG: hypothetical protein HY698_03805 [Deltaproteobacteria bacterium]|nr:hypothetical protein [Deltaproteobacteria bacterium]
MKITTVGDWQLARQLVSTAQKRVKDAADKAVLQEAQFYRTKILEGLRSRRPAISRA